MSIKKRKIEISDVIALVSAVFALLALFVSIYTALVTERVATSGFQSAEKVKSDTASLMAALRGIMVKGALYSQLDKTTRDDSKSSGYVDIAPEKTVIQGFIDSPTALAYYAYAADRSKEAREQGDKPEAWRTFFLSLTDVLRTDNPYSAAKKAGELEKMFDAVSDRDLTEISSNLEDLPGSIKRVLQDRSYDPLIAAITSDDDQISKDDFKAFIKYLKNQGVKDPDVDLFQGVFANDVNVVKDALAHGAKTSTTDVAIVNLYKDQWEKFKASSK